MLGDTTSVFDSGWPAYDAALVAEDSVTMAVQVNGKTRGTISVSKDGDAGRGAGRGDGRAGDREVRDGRAEEDDLRAGTAAEHRGELVG